MVIYVDLRNESGEDATSKFATLEKIQGANMKYRRATRIARERLQDIGDVALHFSLLRARKYDADDEDWSLSLTYSTICECARGSSA